MLALIYNRTWELMHVLASKKVIGCKWVCMVKVNLMTPVAKLASICLLLF